MNNENEIIDDVGVNDESPHEKNDDDDIYDIFDEDRDTLDADDILWVKTTKAIWKGRITGILYSDMPCDSNYLKTEWLDTKTEYRVLKNASFGEIKKRMTISTKNILVGIKWKNL